MSVNAMTEEYEHIELFGKPALFTNARVDTHTVPDGWHVYDLRGSDNDPGSPCTLEILVVVNHAGSIRTLHAEDISFAEDIIQNDNLLEFYMEVSFHADEVFGTNVCTTENDDWLNIYANYDLDARRVCDTLEVYLQRGNGDEEAFKYRLSAEEQALLLPRMNTYCQEYWGQSLEECSANYLSEQSPASPEMQM